MKIFSIIILFLQLLFFSCQQDTASSTNESMTCFCDSIFDNTHSDTIKEFLCYKGKKVYKLQQWRNRQSLSRHSLNDNRWFFENLETTSDNKLAEQHQYFLTTNIEKDSLVLTFILNSIDSMRVVIEHQKDTILVRSFFANKAKFDKNIFRDSLNFVSVYGYTHDSLPLPETGVLSLVTTERLITYRTKYLLDNSLDKILPKFQKCIARPNSDKNGY